MAGLLCGAHAQILAAAESSIGRRVAGATRADVRRALWEDRGLVKTFGPRGMVCLLPAADLPMWTAARHRELDDEAVLAGTVIESGGDADRGPGDRPPARLSRPSATGHWSACGAQGEGARDWLGE